VPLTAWKEACLPKLRTPTEPQAELYALLPAVRFRRALVREDQRIDPAALRAAPDEGLREQTADLSGL
jgi:hypothetical protein